MKREVPRGALVASPETFYGEARCAASYAVRHGH